MKILRLVGGIFAAVGVVLIVVAAVIYQRDRAFVARAERAAGEVVQLVPSWERGNSGSSQTYASRVRFTTRAGRVIEFVDGLSSRPARHAEGDKVEVLYDPRSPSEAVIDETASRWLGLIIVSILAAVFAPIGFTLLAVHRRSARRKARLQSAGRSIQAKFLHVFRDDSLSINGRHPFRVAAQGADPHSGSLRRFDSPPIWVDPTEQLTGKSVKVLLGSGDDYLVDLRGIVDDSALAE